MIVVPGSGAVLQGHACVEILHGLGESRAPPGLASGGEIPSSEVGALASIRELCGGTIEQCGNQEEMASAGRAIPVGGSHSHAHLEGKRLELLVIHEALRGLV